MHDELYTVVVADDEPELREAVCQMIRWEDIGLRLVGSAGNGLDALQLVEQLQPDLLLTDIHMPFISGVELARQVRELRPMTQIAFLSGYDDFEYAQQAIACDVISYLLKPIGMAELTAALADIRRKLEEKYQALRTPVPGSGGWLEFVAPLLLDEFTGEEELDEAELAAQAVRAGLLEGPGEAVELAVLALEPRRGGAPAVDQAVARSCDLILSKTYRSRSVPAGGRILTLLVSGQGFDRLPVVLDELCQALGRVWRLQCTLGVSRSTGAWSKCRAACREAVDALRLSGPEAGGIHDLPQPAAERREPVTDAAELAARVESLIRTGSRAELEVCLGTALAGPANRDAAVLQILAAVQRVLFTETSAEEARQLWRRCRLPEELFAGGCGAELPRRTINLCLAVRDLLADRRRDGVSLLCSQALEAINQGYMDEGISLSTVSERLHVSPNYLSANMKKHAGDTFINLLIKKRMEVAGELLKNTNLKILEVARRCGYSDQHYFSYCFKKYYGVSPVQLRRGRKEGAP